MRDIQLINNEMISEFKPILKTFMPLL